MKKTIRCRLRCGRVIVVDADELLTVAHLKHLIVQQAKIDDAHDLLTLHLARVNDQWLNTDTTNNTEFQQQVQAILGGNTAMDRDDRVGDAELGFPTLSTLERGDIHVLVRLPGDGPTTQPNPPAAEVAVPVEITSRVEGAPVKEQDTPAGVLRWCSTVLGSTLGWISASKSSSLSLETKKNQ